MALKKCPFCGSEASFLFETGRYGPFGYVECDLCGARTKTKKVVKNFPIEDNEEAFWNQPAFLSLENAWNKRAGGDE